MNEIPPLYDKETICLMCSAEFETKRLRSRAVRLLKTYNDFYKEYKDPVLNPVLYEVNVCIKCGFAYTDQFEPVKAAEDKELFAEKVTARWNPQNYSLSRTYNQAVKTFKLAVMAGNITNQPAVVMAGLSLKLSWIYRFLGTMEEEKRFKHHAAAYYESSLLNGDFKDKGMSELSLLYLLGELNRQLNQFVKAGQFFSEVLQHEQRHLEPQLLDKAREQWYEAREEMKNTK
ncbi:DUF2225 domain-containing protein [Alkalicoccus daliensis]|uniref:DUF2225 domain-containing protein n=1 Tax=Alkalicoccus daliensis TaxID=745820 RepID=A0A1H0I8M3_9BACI|nr:DUF2225 domain-containing protein [Alkalicoccus daliensis]SDO27451.1 hypothetical protein SAMN04488053_11036 [Alkalicoccus daliensis]